MGGRQCARRRSTTGNVAATATPCSGWAAPDLLQAVKHRTRHNVAQPLATVPRANRYHVQLPNLFTRLPWMHLRVAQETAVWMRATVPRGLWRRTSSLESSVNGSRATSLTPSPLCNLSYCFQGLHLPSALLSATRPPPGAHRSHCGRH